MLKPCWPDSPKQPRGFTMNKTGAEERLDLNFGKQFRSPPGACTDLWRGSKYLSRPRRRSILARQR
jgi:hypothetical protein